MAFTPSTNLRLLNVPLTPDGKYTIDFNSKNEQFNYFISKTVKNVNDFTYQRKDNIIRINAEIDTLYNCNYVMYQNSNYTNKWFYCFITDMEYVNNNVTHIKIDTDVFQTWLFDFELQPSVVVREHVINDTFGKNTLPENLPIGDLKIINSTPIGDNLSAQTAQEFDEKYYCVVMTSEIIKHMSNNMPKVDSFVGGVTNPCYMYATDSTSFHYFIDKINDNGQAGAIVSCVAIPKFFCKYHKIDENEPDNPNPPITSDSNYLGSPYNTNFRLVNVYGYSPAHGGQHDGQDLTAGDYANIYATCAGTVVYSQFNEGGFGYLVVIQDFVDNEYFHFYGHMDSKSPLSVGDIVSRGAYIGVQGNTGDSTFNHLHYEISKGFNTSDWSYGSINPSEFLKARYPNEEIYPNEVGEY